MTTQVFDYTLTRLDYDEAFDAAETPSNGGVTITYDEFGSAYGLYAVSVDLIVGTGTPKTFAQWLAFVRAVRGAFDTFLWKDSINSDFYQVTNSVIGTGNGSSTDFALVHSCIDAATVVVKDNGSTVSPGNYTLVDNYTAPLIRFSTPPTSGHSITISYEFYYPVRFRATPPLGQWQFGTYIVNGVGVIEDYPEAHRSPYTSGT